MILEYDPSPHTRVCIQDTPVRQPPYGDGPLRQSEAELLGGCRRFTPDPGRTPPI